MPGEEVKGQLKKYDTIFFNGNRRRDVPALKYTIIYGVHTKRGQMSTRVTGINYRRKARSKYGIKRFVLEPEKAAAAAGVVAGDVPAREDGAVIIKMENSAATDSSADEETDGDSSVDNIQNWYGSSSRLYHLEEAILATRATRSESRGKVNNTSEREQPSASEKKERGLAKDYKKTTRKGREVELSINRGSDVSKKK